MKFLRRFGASLRRAWAVLRGAAASLRNAFNRWDLFLLAGIAMTARGFGMIQEYAGWIAAGIICLLLGAFGLRNSK